MSRPPPVIRRSGWKTCSASWPSTTSGPQFRRAGRPVTTPTTSRRCSVTGKPIGSSVRANTTTNRVRRHDAEHDADAAGGESALATRIVGEAPPAPARPPRPAGDLSAAAAEDVVSAVGGAFAGRNRNTLADYRHGMRRLLETLQQHPGGTWQERWEAAGLNEPGHPVGDLAGDDPKWAGPAPDGGGQRLLPEADPA